MSCVVASLCTWGGGAIFGGVKNFLVVFVEVFFEKLGEEMFWWGVVQSVVEIFPSFG
ncbi:hypothetical protein MNL08_05940 [Bartonella krasnovii]|uniref:hypothetical protein n=1 Tax=Bartonella krasnovii TaxID=2267275 RepID=UPI001F4C5D1F|nr:hypothetical protein [Bartonella krasnovii]UNF41731.1 hypothetical protein MNL08_05940 [Bartonella krasnovii]